MSLRPCIPSPLLAALVFFLFAICPGAWAQGSCSYTFHVEELAVSGKSIPVEVYRPDAPGPHPLVFMIHGSAGAFTLRDGQRPRPSNFGEETFAQHCYVVALPHYFALTGDRSIVDEPRLRTLFPSFLDELRAILAVEANLLETRDRPIFLYGESYGGFLAVALTGQVAGVRAVSVYGAGLPESFAPRIAALPPLLIQHGDRDSIVAPAKAVELQSFWMHAPARVQLKLYPGGGHYFSETDRAELLAETLAWFDAARNDPR